MPSPDRRSLSLATLLLAGVLVGIPLAGGGRSPIGQVSLILLLVLAGAAGTLGRGLGGLGRPSPLLLAAGILAAGSALHTIYPDRTIQHLLLLFAYLLAGTLAARGAREVPWAERLLLTAILTSGILVCATGMVSLIREQNSGLYANLLTGPFGYPNAVAGFLLLTGGAALAMVREDRSPLIRAEAMAAGILAIIGLFLSGSRGVLLAAAMGCAVWVAGECERWWPPRRLWLWLAGIGILGALVWAARSWSGFLPALSRLGDPMADSSLLWRRQILRWTWAMAWDHPWWGVGPGAYPVALTHYQRIPYVSGENPHNLYLELAAEYGLPAGILAALMVVGFLGRVGAAIWRTPAKDPVRGRLTALLATLTAFAVHSLLDLDWSFPAIAVTAATMLGLTAAHLPSRLSWATGPPMHDENAPLPRWGRGEVRGDFVRSIRGSGSAPFWGVGLIILLATAAILSLTRYYASTLVSWGRLALASREAALAQRDLTWALRLNPVSFPAHQWMAWARLLTGDPRGAADVAERAAWIAPADPNSHYLAGEIAAASGRWSVAEDRFRAAVDLAPSAQLRFYAGLVESAANAGRGAEARFRYEQAVAIFSEERVLDSEARCLMPGDRYLLARMSRIAARSYGEAGDASSRDRTMDLAKRLAQPDVRGICISRGSPGQTSPEAVMESFWRSLAEGGWPEAERFLTPGLRASQPRDDWGAWEKNDRPRRARVPWVAALQGGETQASLRFEVEIEIAPDQRVSRCAQADLQIIKDSWFIDRLPVMEAAPCRP